jgi:hypothetical protein
LREQITERRGEKLVTSKDEKDNQVSKGRRKRIDKKN